MEQIARYKPLLILILIFFILTGCSREKPVEKYYRFANTSWNRFNILRFELPVKQKNGSYDILL